MKLYYCAQCANCHERIEAQTEEERETWAKEHQAMKWLQVK